MSQPNRFPPDRSSPDSVDQATATCTSVSTSVIDPLLSTSSAEPLADVQHLNPIPDQSQEPDLDLVPRVPRKIMAYSHTESYASRSDKPLKKGKVDTGLPMDLIESESDDYDLSSYGF